MKKAALFFIMICLMTVFLSADVYIKSESHTPAIKGNNNKILVPEKNEISEQWIGTNKFAHVTSKTKLIIDLNTRMAIIVDYLNKIYVETPLPLDMMKLIPQKSAETFGSPGMTITVTPIEKTEKINNWNCKGYNVVIELTGKVSMTMNQVVWATTDVPFDWKKYKEGLYPSFVKAMMGQYNLDDNALNQLQTIEGFQVGNDTAIDAMGSEIKMKSRVVEITEKEAPEDIYSIPTDFTKSEQLIMPKETKTDE